MAKDGYKAVRLREATYDRLVELRDRIKQLGTNKLPPAMRADVSSLSDVVDVAISAATKVLK